MKDRIKQMLRESLQPKKAFLGPCDRVRAQSTENEQKWHEMMANKKQIPLKTFVNSVDMPALLDDGETVKVFFNDAYMSDKESSPYISNWGDKECMFFQTTGFEFIFV